MEIALLALAAIAGWAAHQFLPPLWRRVTGRKAVDVHVETDPGVFLAGDPNWDAFGYLIPKEILDVGPPPSDICRDWHTWALDQGGVSAGWSRVRLILSGHLDATVLVDQVRIKVEGRRPPDGGVHVRCRTGGADAMPRGFSVDLDRDPPWVSHVDPGGDPIHAPMALSIAEGEIEVFEIEARSTYEVVEWNAEIALVINGRRQVLTVSDSGSPFVTAGTDGFPAYEWSGSEWERTALG